MNIGTMCIILSAFVVAASCRAGGETVNFVWESKHFGKPGYVGQQRVEKQVVPGKGHCVLVSRQKAVAKIMLAADPTRAAQVAAAELRHYVKKMTGVEMDVVNDEIPPYNMHLALVGESRLTKALGLKASDLVEQEFLIRNYGDMLVLMGCDEPERGMISYDINGLWPEFSFSWQWQRKPEWSKKIGSVYAVDEFLQRVCGVRWYMPGDLGEVCPRLDPVCGTNLDLRLRPWTDYRFYTPQAMRDYFNFLGSDKSDEPYHVASPRGFRDINLWAMRMKVVGCEAHYTNHSLIGEWFKTRLKDQPQVWDAIKATGFGEDPKQLCLTSDTLLNVLVQDAKDYLAEKQNLERAHGDYFPVMAHDYSGMWCKCENCRRLLKPLPRQFGFWGGGASDLMWGLVDRTARRLKTETPGLWASCCAYAEYTLPPAFDLSDNVAAMFCRVLVEYFHEDKAGYKEFAREQLAEWSRRVKRLYVWEYFDHIQMNGQEAFFPGIYLREIEDDLDFCRSIGVKGTFVEMNSKVYGIPNFAQDHLNLYVWLRLAGQDRNERLKAEDLFKEYCAKFYGPAARPMEAFFRLAEERFTNPAFRKLSGDQLKPDWETICPPSVLEQFRALVEKARELAAEEPFATRVRLMREAVFGMMEKNCLKHQGLIKNKRALEVAKLAAGESPFGSPRRRTREFAQPNGNASSRSTTAWVDYDDANLYVRFECAEPAMQKVRRAVKPNPGNDETSAIFGDDSVEVFIDVGRRRDGVYFQKAANLNGALWEAKWRRPEPPDKSLRTETKVVVAEGKDGWTADFTIPLKSLKPDGPIRPGEQWGLNLCRNIWTGGAVEFSCWAPAIGNYHEVKGFGVVTFK